MGSFIVHASSMSTIRSTDDGIMIKRPGFEPSSVPALMREIEALRGLSEYGISGRIPEVISVEGEGENLGLTMSTLGSHDLRDLLHEVPEDFIPGLFEAMASDLHSIHEAGFVHRDVKPGNFMLDYSTKEGGMSYRGIIDFGMALRLNKSQSGALGGTRNYSHPSQMNRELEGFRAHPGQDWFALGRTMSHILVGGSEGSFKSSIESGGMDLKVSKAIDRAFAGSGNSEPFSKLILYSLTTESQEPDSLGHLLSLGRGISSKISHPSTQLSFSSFSEAAKALSLDHPKSSSTKSGFQEGAGKRPRRHDMLIIVDSTGSMTDEIEDLRDALSEVTVDVSSAPLDLRVDIWALSDYGREENSQDDPVRILGKRLRSDALALAIGTLNSDSQQLDDAEAYEAALQDAYLKEKWKPRKNSTRSIVLVGDSYPHGWLTRSYWALFFSEIKGKSWSKYRKFDPDEHQRKYDLFLDRHPVARDKPWEWGRMEEEEARKQAASEKSDFDDFSGRGHVKVPSSDGLRLRPNVMRALEKCASEMGASVHTIFAGQNLVSRNFMKFAAMVGEGSFTQIASGELKIALRALFTSPDQGLFAEFSKEVISSNPDTQALHSITSFVFS